MKTWTNKDTLLAQVQRFMLHGWPSQEPKGGVQQNWRRKKLSVLDGCIVWGARAVVPPQGRNQVIQELRKIHPALQGWKVWQEAVCGGRTWMQTWKPKCEPVCTKCQSSRPPELLCWCEEGCDIFNLWLIELVESLHLFLYAFCYYIKVEVVIDFVWVQWSLQCLIVLVWVYSSMQTCTYPVAITGSLQQAIHHRVSHVISGVYTNS